MAARTTTEVAYLEAEQAVLAVLTLGPDASLDEVVQQIPFSKRSIQRALKSRGSSFSRLKRGIKLDRAAVTLLSQQGRGQRIALLNAAAVAGGCRPRHLCAPFRDRYGVTPGVVWRIGCSIRELENVAAQAPIHSRHDPAGYMRRRRRLLRSRARLHAVAHDLHPDTVVAQAVIVALSLPTANWRQMRAKHNRARRRRRGRRRTGPR